MSLLLELADDVVVGAISVHVGVPVRTRTIVVNVAPSPAISVSVRVPVAIEPPPLSERGPVGEMSCSVVVGERKRRLYLSGTGTPLPPTDDLGWTAPDVTVPAVRGVIVKLGGTRIQKALIDGLDIELDDRGGPKSALLTMKRDVRKLPVSMLKKLEVTYKGQRLFKGRLEARERELGDDMTAPMTFSGSMAELDDHKAYRRDFVCADLDEWRLDQPPGSGSGSVGD